MPQVKVPFGKYRGCWVAEVPDDYLTWLATIELQDWLETAVLSELARRGYGADTDTRYTASSQRALPAAVDPEVAAEIVAAGRRALALRHHPDRGGDAEKMVRVNASADWLEHELANILRAVRS